jgi:hypothetical protein
MVDLRIKNMNKARKKVLEDIKEQKDESKRMVKDPRLEWRIRGFIVKCEYWAVAYNFPIAILIGIITQDFWKGIAFWFATQLYIFSGNFRGMSLHIENLVEWITKKII